MRVGTEALVGCRYAHFAQVRDGLLASGLAPQAVVYGERLDDLLPDRQDRIEGRTRLLKDHGDAAAPYLGHLPLAQLAEVGSV